MIGPYRVFALSDVQAKFLEVLLRVYGLRRCWYNWSLLEISKSRCSSGKGCFRSLISLNGLLLLLAGAAFSGGGLNGGTEVSMKANDSGASYRVEHSSGQRFHFNIGGQGDSDFSRSRDPARWSWILYVAGWLFTYPVVESDPLLLGSSDITEVVADVRMCCTWTNIIET